MKRMDVHCFILQYLIVSSIQIIQITLPGVDPSTTSAPSPTWPCQPDTPGGCRLSWRQKPPSRGLSLTSRSRHFWLGEHVSRLVCVHTRERPVYRPQRVGQLPQYPGVLAASSDVPLMLSFEQRGDREA